LGQKNKKTVTRGRSKRKTGKRENSIDIQNEDGDRINKSI